MKQVFSSETFILGTWCYNLNRFAPTFVIKTNRDRYKQCLLIYLDTLEHVYYSELLEQKIIFGREINHSHELYEFDNMGFFRFNSKIDDLIQDLKNMSCEEYMMFLGLEQI